MGRASSATPAAVRLGVVERVFGCCAARVVWARDTGVSVELVKKAMRKFLGDPTPGVLCIEGRWGTGKTYAWNEAVKEATETKSMGLSHYAYVSLFGIKDSADILQSVFANTDGLGRHGPADIVKIFKSLPACAPRKDRTSAGPPTRMLAACRNRKWTTHAYAGRRQFFT
jgi:hypothetical protein